MQNKNIKINKLKALNRPNPVGLKLEFNLEGDTARTEFSLNENHQGLSGYAHDGIIAFLMDVGMGWLARHGAGVNSVTATMTIDFHNLAQVGKPLIMISQIIKKNKRLLEETVRIEGKDGTLIAEGTCLQYIIGFNQDSRNTNRRLTA